MTQRYRKLIASIGLAGAFAAAAVPTAMAKNGADDPPNHNAGDDNGGLVVKASRGADDPVNHDVNDDSKTAARKTQVRHRHRHAGRHRAHHARNGADDPAGHNQGDDRGAR